MKLWQNQLVGYLIQILKLLCPGIFYNDAAGVQRAALQHFSQNTHGICYSAIIEHKCGTYLNILSKKIYWKFGPLKHNLIIFLFVKDASNLHVCSRLTVLTYHLFSAWQNTKPEQLVWIKAPSINRTSPSVIKPPICSKLDLTKLCSDGSDRLLQLLRPGQHQPGARNRCSPSGSCHSSNGEVSSTSHRPASLRQERGRLSQQHRCFSSLAAQKPIIMEGSECFIRTDVLESSDDTWKSSRPTSFHPNVKNKL